MGYTLIRIRKNRTTPVQSYSVLVCTNKFNHRALSNKVLRVPYPFEGFFFFFTKEKKYIEVTNPHYINPQPRQMLK